MAKNLSCESGIFTPDPDFHACLITDPDFGSQIQQEKQKRGKNCCLNFFFWEPSYHKFKIILFLHRYEKIWANWQGIVVFSIQKLSMSLSSQKYGVGIREQRSGIWKNLSQIQGSKRHRLQDSEHWPKTDNGWHHEYPSVSLARQDPRLIPAVRPALGTYTGIE